MKKTQKNISELDNLDLVQEISRAANKNWNYGYWMGVAVVAAACAGLAHAWLLCGISAMATLVLIVLGLRCVRTFYTLTGALVTRLVDVQLSVALVHRHNEMKASQENRTLN